MTVSIVEMEAVIQLVEKQVAIVLLIVEQAARRIPISLVLEMIYIGIVPAEDERGDIEIAEHLRMVRGQMIIVIEEMYIKKELITNVDVLVLLAFPTLHRLSD